MLIPHEAFGAHAEAHLRYAIGLDGEGLVAAIRFRLRDGSWRSAANAFVGAVEWLAHRQPDGARAVFAELAEDLIAGALDESSKHVLDRGLHRDGSWNEDERRRLATWFARSANINDAPFAARLLQDESPHSRRSLHPLAEWLVDSGGTELLAARHLGLLFNLVEMMLEAHDETRTEHAVRYLLECEHRLDAGSFTQLQLDRLADALDALLAAQNATAATVVDLARKLSRREAGELLANLAAPSERPALSSALLSVLSCGQLRKADAVAAWGVVLRRDSPPDHLALTTDGAADLLDGLNAIWDYNAAPPTLATWTELLGRELLRRSNGRLEQSAVAVLNKLAGYPRLADSIGRALRESDTVATDDSLLAKLLAAPSPSSVYAALSLVSLCPAAGAPTPQWTSRIEQAISRAVEEVLASDSAHFAKWLARLRRVEWVALTNGESVELRDDTLLINRADVAALGRARLSDDDLVTSGALYVLHELLHRYQQVGGPAAVHRVREAHAESTLMHLDLAADHWAAVLLHHVRSDRSLAALKRVQGASSQAFPVEARHTTAARSRKARRLVALRLDVVVREHAPDVVDSDEYVFAEYGPTGGPFVLLVSGKIWRLIGTTTVSSRDAKLLFDAGNPEAALHDLDRALIGLVRKCFPSETV